MYKKALAVPQVDILTMRHETCRVAWGFWPWDSTLTECLLVKIQPNGASIRRIVGLCRYEDGVLNWFSIFIWMVESCEVSIIHTINVGINGSARVFKQIHLIIYLNLWSKILWKSWKVTLVIATYYNFLCVITLLSISYKLTDILLLNNL